MKANTGSAKLHTGMTVVVEGRDDVDAVSKACSDLIIPTHGFGITAETWGVIAKAYEETGLIIMTDPDHAGEEIRRRLNDRFPGSVNCYLAREDALDGSDIGIENASPETIRSALTRALELHGASSGQSEEKHSFREVTASDLAELGLSGAEGAAARRAAVCRTLGIGFCNSGAMLTRLRGFRIGYTELKKALDEETQNK